MTKHLKRNVISLSCAMTSQLTCSDQFHHQPVFIHAFAPLVRPKITNDVQCLFILISYVGVLLLKKKS